MKLFKSMVFIDELPIVEKKKARGRALKQNSSLSEKSNPIVEKKKARGRALKHCILVEIN